MPTSRHEHISDVVTIIKKLSPNSLLDIGCGYGRWGILAREQLDIYQNRYYRDDWRAQIDAVEVFGEYLLPYHSYFYNSIYNVDVREYVESMHPYDVIVMGDALEHVEKKEGIHLLNVLRKNVNYGLIVSVPLGEQPQGEVFGNPYEVHRAVWTIRDLKQTKPNLIKVYGTYSKQALVVWSSRKLPNLPGNYEIYLERKGLGVRLYLPSSILKVARSLTHRSPF